MPNYKNEIIEYHKERVREVLALNPHAGLRSIRQFLENDPQTPLVLDVHYIGKLKQKIIQERKRRFDQTIVEERLSEIQDRTESVAAQMWQILLDAGAPEVARVAAAKVIIDSEHKLLEAQMNAGVFERKFGSVDIRHTYELAPEMKAMVLKTLANYGIIKNPEPKLPDARTDTGDAR